MAQRQSLRNVGLRSVIEVICLLVALFWTQNALAAELLSDVAVRLEPYAPFPYVEPGAHGKVSFLFTSTADRPLTLTWDAQITLPSGKGAALSEKLSLAPAATMRIAIPDSVATELGVVSFEWQLSDQFGRVLALEDTLAVMTLPGPELSHRAGFRFGWGNALVHFVTSPGEEAVMDTYAQMGIDLIRVGDKWAYSEYNGDQATANANNNYWADAEPIVNGASKAGMDLLYVMWGTPLNLARPGFSNEGKLPEMAAATKTNLDLMLRVRPPAPAAWQVRVKDTVTRFKDRVKYWELWNDEDRYHDNGHHMPNGWLGNTDEYLELLREGSKQIKAIDPQLNVLNGGLFTVAEDSRHSLNPDMGARVVREGQSAFDVHAAFDTDPALLLGPLAEQRKEFDAPKPLWLTRVEQRGSTPDELVRRVLSAKGSGASAFVWMWALNFDSGGRGILTPMSSWKTPNRKPLNQHSYFQMQPAGCAYVHAIGLLRMLGFSARLDTGTKGQWLFTFSDPTRHDPRQVVGFWHDDKMADSAVQLRFGGKARGSQLDIYGNATPLTVAADGTVSVTIKRTPTYVVMTDGDGVSVLGGATAAPTITTQPADQMVAAGQTATFEVVATGTAPLTYEWKLGTTSVGTNSSRLIVENAQPANAGSYTVTVSNAAGSQTSSAATLALTAVLGGQDPVATGGSGGGSSGVAGQSDAAGGQASAGVAAPETQADPGCACSLGGGTREPATAWWTLLFALATAMRRRRALP